MIYISDMSPEMFLRLTPFPVSDIMLDRVHTWSTDDKPITLREYLAARAPQAAEKLGIGTSENPAIVDSDQLNYEQLRKVTLEIYLLGDRNTDLAIWGQRSYTHDEMIEDLRNNCGVASELIRMHMQSMSFQESIFRTGHVRFEPNPPKSYQDLHYPDPRDLMK